MNDCEIDQAEREAQAATLRALAQAMLAEVQGLVALVGEDEEVES